MVFQSNGKDVRHSLFVVSAIPLITHAMVSTQQFSVCIKVWDEQVFYNECIQCKY